MSETKSILGAPPLWSAQIEIAREMLSAAAAFAGSTGEANAALMATLARRNAAFPMWSAWSEAQRNFQAEALRAMSRAAQQFAEACEKAAAGAEKAS